ncbi:hypothetical protein OV079_10815 [Nannocystis pusilla]|uniref:Uncharacterized protein n=1 Tax=Nannocystis pusilla TaxID=889268 RepID=A0A9X3IXP4_9BACT|nr:hypothetical protein [Nannocystis pusilla]MCY1006043.1 hypothetical protein [Nannocystis pusilla]
MTRAALAVALLGAACSTAAPDEQGRSCMDDTDCLMGQVCDNNICLENDLPPPEGIAIDVQTAVPPFRIELRGNDAALQRILDRLPNRYYVDRAQVRDRLQIEVLEKQLDDLEEGTGPEVPVAASIELQQPSRFARSPFVVTDLSFPPPTPDGSVDESPVLFKSWPRYDAADIGADQPLYAKLTYQDDVAGDQPFQWGRGIVARQLMRRKNDEPADDEFELRTVRECHRRVLGNIRFPDGPLANEPPLETPATVTVNMRHAGRADDGDPETPICDPNPVGETPATCSIETVVKPAYPTCTTSGQCPEPFQCYDDPDGNGKRCGCKRDSECPQGQVCRVDLQQCALDLTDRPAIKQVTAEAVDDAAVSAWIYTYCDEDPTADRTMEFVVSTAADARLGLPRLNYRVVLTFLVGDLMGSTPLGRICLPTWQRARGPGPAEGPAGAPVQERGRTGVDVLRHLLPGRGGDQTAPCRAGDLRGQASDHRRRHLRHPRPGQLGGRRLHAAERRRRAGPRPRHLRPGRLQRREQRTLQRQPQPRSGRRQRPALRLADRAAGRLAVPLDAPAGHHHLRLQRSADGGPGSPAARPAARVGRAQGLLGLHVCARRGPRRARHPRRRPDDPARPLLLQHHHDLQRRREGL